MRKSTAVKLAAGGAVLVAAATAYVLLDRTREYAVSYGDAQKQAIFKAVLDRAAIPYRTEIKADGSEQIVWKKAHDKAVVKAHVAAFSEPIKHGPAK